MNKTANNPTQPPNPLEPPIIPQKRSQTPFSPPPKAYTAPSPTPPILQNKANLNTPLTPLTPSSAST